MSDNRTEMEKRKAVRLSNREANRLTRECLQMALIELMKQKKIENISVTELVRQAGVSRTAFYSNYSTLNDIFAEFIDESLKVLNDELWEAVSNEEDIFHPILIKLKEKKAVIDLIIKSRMENTAFLKLREYIRKNYPQIDNETYYQLIAIIGMIRNIIVEWFINGCRESAEEISSICNTVTGELRTQVVRKLQTARR